MGGVLRDEFAKAEGYKIIQSQCGTGKLHLK